MWHGRRPCHTALFWIGGWEGSEESGRKRRRTACFIGEKTPACPVEQDVCVRIWLYFPYGDDILEPRYAIQNSGSKERILL